LQAAIAHLQRAIAIYPDYLAARNDLGAQYLKLKQFEPAAEQFRLVLDRNPKYFNSLFNLALIMIERKDYAGAIVQLNQAIAVDQARPAGHFWLGIAFLNLGELSGAERELSKALITGGANFAAAHYYRAQIHLKNKNEVEAVRSLKAYLEEAPRGEFVADARQLLKRLSTGSSPARP
jgi:tetratricopeptide (TPR) repeat protein